MKKILIPVIIVILVVAGYLLLSRPPSMHGVADNEAELILFWGDGCPHCKLVEDYISQNKVDSLVKISYKEVYYNRTNQEFMAKTAQKCPNIDTSQGMAVPMAYLKSTNECLVGDQPIIGWLSSRVLK